MQNTTAGHFQLVRFLLVHLGIQLDVMIGPIEFHLPSVTSTNDYAKELLRTYPYVFVSAMHQTAGRGRKGKEWLGDHGANIYCSFGLTHSEAVVADDLATFMARGALATLSTLRMVAPRIALRLKYPNDIQAHNGTGWAKISGVLIEHEFHGSRCTGTVVGIGVNVEQEVFGETIGQPSTSLVLLGVQVQLTSLLHGIKQEFQKIISEAWPDVHQAWVRELDVVGKHVSVVGVDGKWTVQRILSDGRLVVREDVTLQERIISDGDSVRYED